MGEKATCRGCGRALEGNPYYTGKPAYIKNTQRFGMIPALSCYYGGHVCSENCDRRACLELEQTMPGHGLGQKRLDVNLDAKITRKWEDHRRSYPGVAI